jgi:hypothetical protein
MTDPRLHRLGAELPVRGEPTTKAVAFDLELGELTANGATPWIASVGLGTPPQPLNFTVDTGTINTWITSTKCTTQACLAHGRFDPETSATYRVVDPKPQQVDFGPWGTMTVVVGKDVFTLKQIFPDSEPPVTLREPLKIQLATQYGGSQFLELAWDGGLAVPSIPVSGRDQPGELLPQLKEEGLIEWAIASFWLDPGAQRGECLFGAVDPSKFDPETMNVIPLLPTRSRGLDYLWAVFLEQFTCGGRVILENAKLALDSGSSWFKGNARIIGKLVKAITDDGRLPTQVRDPAALAQYPDVALSLNGVSYCFTPQQYFLRIPPGGDRWVLGFHVLEGMPENLLLVGSLFMERVYSVFFYETGIPDVKAIVLAAAR